MLSRLPVEAAFGEKHGGCCRWRLTLDGDQVLCRPRAQFLRRRVQGECIGCVYQTWLRGAKMARLCESYQMAAQNCV